MEDIQKRVKGINYIFKVEKIENLEGDVLVVWTDETFLKGDETTRVIYYEAGTILYEEVLGTKMLYNTEIFKEGATLVTKTGFLQFYKCLHCVHFKNTSNMIYCLEQINNTFVYLKERKISVFSITLLPFSNALAGQELSDKDIRKGLKYIISKYKEYHTISFNFVNQQERDKYVDIFEDLLKNPLFIAVKKIKKRFSFLFKIRKRINVHS